MDDLLYYHVTISLKSAQKTIKNKMCTTCSKLIIKGLYKFSVCFENDQQQGGPWLLEDYPNDESQSTPNLPKNEHFLPAVTHTYVCVSLGKKCSFLENLVRFVFL